MECFYCMDNEANKHTNPCGICRSMGASSCKGHAGGGAGNDEDSPDKDQAENDEKKQFLEIAPLLGQNWHKEEHNSFIFNDFGNNAALLSIQLDLDNNKLIINSKDGLEDALAEDKNELFNSISEIASNIDNANILHNQDSLEIQTSSNTDLISLTSNLIKANFIPTQSMSQQLDNTIENESDHTAEQEADVQNDSSFGASF